MKIIRLFHLVVLVVLSLVTVTSAAETAPASVVKIVIDGVIHPVAAEYIGRAIEDAKQQHAQALLIVLDTPGGLVDSTREIIGRIDQSPVPVIIFVTPAGTRAASAGFILLESADVAAMSPGTHTGAAHPVLMVGKMDEEMKKKAENDVAAMLRAVASKRGRNVELAETGVRESKSFTEQEALKQNLIDYVASSEEDLFRQMKGKPIKRFGGETTTLDLTSAVIQPYPMTLKLTILNFLMNPNITLIVLVIGALCLYFEFNHPGAVIPGTVGAIFIVLAVFALGLLPTNYAGLALIVLAFVLFILEAKFASHGVLGIGGIVSFTLGALLLVDGPIPEMRVGLVTALAVAIPFGVITVFLMTIVLRARANKRVSGAEGLVGSIGMTQTALTPQGKVFVHGEIWDAVAAGEVAFGQRVIVKRVDGLLLEVEALPFGASRS
jgi:membrane-bound serine protease (ClpP class)